MSRVQMKTMTWLAALCLLFSLCVPSALPKPQAGTSFNPADPSHHHDEEDDKDDKEKVDV